jgi:hypothetical protein
MLFLWQNIPTSDWNDVRQERRHHTVLLCCKMQEERSHLQERPAQAEMDNVLREERTRLSNVANLTLTRNGGHTIAHNREFVTLALFV